MLGLLLGFITSAWQNTIGIYGNIKLIPGFVFDS